MKKLLFFISIMTAYLVTAQTVSTYAGTGAIGSADGPAASATFRGPAHAAIDAAGNIFVADMLNNKIRKIDASGVVSTYAGTGAAGSANGPAASATFSYPRRVLVDNAGNVYVADGSNHKIRKIDTSGNVTTFAGDGTSGSTDGPAASASFTVPNGLAIDSAGNIYVVDSNNQKIRKIDTSGNVTTFAGTGAAGSTDGPVASATFNNPSGITIDGLGNIYIADTSSHTIRKIDTSGNVTTFAGSGGAGYIDDTGTAAKFSMPGELSADILGNIYVSDYGNNRVRKITPAGVVTTLAGNGTRSGVDGPASSATFNLNAVVVDSYSNVLVSDYGNNKIRKITVNSLAAQSVSEKKLQISPNPAKDFVTISNINKGAQISVSDMTGKLLYQTKATSTTHSLNTSAYKNGVYLLKVDGQTTKLLITK